VTSVKKNRQIETSEKGGRRCQGVPEKEVPKKGVLRKARGRKDDARVGGEFRVVGFAEESQNVPQRVRWGKKNGDGLRGDSGGSRWRSKGGRTGTGREKAPRKPNETFSSK